MVNISFFLCPTMSFGLSHLINWWLHTVKRVEASLVQTTSVISWWIDGETRRKLTVRGCIQIQILCYMSTLNSNLITQPCLFACSNPYIVSRNGEITGPSSTIDCHLVKQTRHHGNGDNLCLLQNVQLELSIFSNATLTSKTVKVSGNGLDVCMRVSFILVHLNHTHYYRRHT